MMFMRNLLSSFNLIEDSLENILFNLNNSNDISLFNSIFLILSKSVVLSNIRIIELSDIHYAFVLKIRKVQYNTNRNILQNGSTLEIWLSVSFHLNFDCLVTENSLKLYGILIYIENPKC